MAKHGPEPRRTSHSRGVDRLEVRERFLIVCEGTKTEPLYFAAFKAAGRIIVIKGTGMNTLSLVDEALRLRQEEETKLQQRGREGFDQCWCVFDRDSFPPNHFKSAINKARANGFRVAYSNEAFELWYLLHFDHHQSALHRHQYGEKLGQLLGRRYEKNDPQVYRALFTRQQTAIRNARALLNSYPTDNPEQNNPSTTVHELVEELSRGTF